MKTEESSEISETKEKQKRVKEDTWEMNKGKS